MSLDAFLQTLKKTGGTGGTPGTDNNGTACRVPARKKPPGTPGTNLALIPVSVPPVPAPGTPTGTPEAAPAVGVPLEPLVPAQKIITEDETAPSDGRRFCRHCQNFNLGNGQYRGYCMALREYQHDDIPRRCDPFKANGKPAPLGRLEESAIRAWLEQIGETNAEVIAETLERCRSDLDARRYFLERADEVSL